RVSYFLDLTLFGRHAAGWHLENVLLHAANAWLLAMLIRKLGAARAFALGSALIFLVAALASETIDWISGRTSLFCCGLLLIGGWCWLDALQARQTVPAGALVAAVLAQM